MFKFFTKAVAIMVILVMMLTGCQSNTSDTTPTTAAPASTNAPAPSEIKNFNPTGYPICPDEPVTLRVLTQSRAEMPSDLNDLPLIQNDSKVMNVKIEWIMAMGATFNEKKNLMLATGDLPDIIESAIPSSDLTKYGPDGTFIPLNKLIDDYGVNFKKLYNEIPILEKYITAPDGNIYSLARINSGPWMPTNGVGIINKMWLDNLGLAMPTTIEEFENVLRAFKTGDPNKNGKADEIPLTFSITNGASPISENNGLSYLFSSFGLAIGNSPTEAYVGVKDGKVYNQGTVPEFKEAIAWFSKLYKEGLMDSEGFTLKNADFAAKINAEPGIIGYSQLWDKNDTVSNKTNNAAFQYMPLLKGPGGRTPVFFKLVLPGTVRGWGEITKACKTPEVAMRWLDYFYDEKNAIEHIEGPIGVRVLENPDGTLYVRKPPEGMSVAEDRFSNCNAGILAMPPSTYMNKLKLPSTDEKVNFINTFMDELKDKEPFPPVFYTAEEAEAMNKLQVDIFNLIEGKASQWIMNGNIEAEWDSYLNELDKAGLAKWISIKQAAYDRFSQE